ncbi:MAG: DNA-binding protein WhiA [Christensenellaceae bacterium]|jgi:DNA-binding protein WhiA|nr:DNA-binding protein WhiA [Christensenellaceae bacterium]
MNLITIIKDELNSREQGQSVWTDVGFVFPFERCDTDITKLKNKETGEFISGVFLSCGGGRIMLGEDRKDVGYHIEFDFENVGNARRFCELLSQFEIFPKLTLVSNLAIIRVQSADCICNLLALVGAKNALMQLNNEIALRELRNDANRRANCDTANIEKQVEASSAQIAIIKKLIANGEMAKLSKKLQETGLARINNPDATYEELAEILNITKSGVVHRLQKIIAYQPQTNQPQSGVLHCPSKNITTQIQSGVLHYRPQIITCTSQNGVGQHTQKIITYKKGKE